MFKASDLLSFLLKAIIAGLALAFVLVYLWPALPQRLAGTPEAAPAEVPAPPASFADAVNRTAPAVVSIYTESARIVTPGEGDETPSRLYRMLPQQGAGSGVLIRPDGYILTNHHVISRASSIKVHLWDGRRIDARVTGSDPATDLAVLKVNLEGLPTAPVAGDPAVRVGDMVLAIGNALGLSHTVTLGIVSATGRDLLASPQSADFIQTDAAINAGNSGGPLINTLGEVIGINSRNLSMIPNAENIGFAIPISVAMDVMEQIIEYGSVQRGWLGVSVQLADAVLNDGTVLGRGLGVRNVAPKGPGWEAGIRPGDLILKMDGQEVEDANQFLLSISKRKPGDLVELEILRTAGTFQTYARLIQQPPTR